MTSYNKGQFIAQAIDSVRKQTLTDWELIIIDDCSTDKTQDLLEYYRRLDERIKPYCRQKNYGCDAAHNLGNKIANTDIILVLDCDDWADKNRAKITYNHFQKHPDTDIFYGSFMTAEPNGQTAILVTGTPVNDEILKRTGMFEICHSTVAYPKRVAEKYPYCGGEWNLYWNVYKDGGIFRCTRSLLGAYRCSERVEADYGKFKQLREKKKHKMGLK